MMYDRLLKLLEAEGKEKPKKPQQPELIRDRPQTIVGGVGSGEAPKDKPWVPNVVIRDGKFVSLNQPSRADTRSIESQRKGTRGAAAPDIHAGRRRRKS